MKIMMKASAQHDETEFGKIWLARPSAFIDQTERRSLAGNSELFKQIQRRDTPGAKTENRQSKHVVASRSSPASARRSKRGRQK
jgi:hypothetical protein